MSISVTAPSTSLLNGYNEAGQASATAQAEAKAKVTKSKATKAATTTHPEGWGAYGTGTSQQYTTPPAQPVLTTAQILAKAGINTTPPSQTNFDPFFMIILPLIFVTGLFWGILKVLMWSIRKYPPYGGFSHRHKKHRPGVPRPKL